MNFAVAGIVWLLVFIVGAVSYMALPLYQSEDREKYQLAGRIRFLRQQIHTFFQRNNLRFLCTLLVMSSVCAFVLCVVSSAENDILGICKWVCVMLALLSAMIIDRRTHRIPNVIVVALLVCGAMFLAAEFIISDEPAWLALVTSLAGLFGCVVVFYVLSRLTKDGIGMGDVKIIAAMGGILGLMTTFFVVLISLIFCTLTAVALLIVKKKNKSDSIPFGPFLFFGYIVTLLIFYL